MMHRDEVENEGQDVEIFSSQCPHSSCRARHQNLAGKITGGTVGISSSPASVPAVQIGSRS
jgi:hypothetical protein